MLKVLTDPEITPLKELMGNHITRAGQVSTYPQLGSALIKSAMVRYANKKNNLAEVKLYSRASQEFRHNMPYSKSKHALLLFPSEQLAVSFPADIKLEHYTKKKLKAIREDVLSRKSLKNGLVYLKNIKRKSYSSRIEITQRNHNIDDIVIAYQKLEALVQKLIQIHVVMGNLVEKSKITPSALRLLPFQILKSSSVVALAQAQFVAIETFLHKLYSQALHVENGT